MGPTLSEPPAGAGAHLGARLGAPAGTSAGVRKVTSMRVQRGIASCIAKPKSKAEMKLNQANKREKDAQYGVALVLIQTDARQNGALDRVLKLQNADGSKRFPRVKRSTLHRLMANGGKGRKTNDTRSVLTVQEEEMLALNINLKGLGDQAVTRKEIKRVIMSLLAQCAAVNRLGGKIAKLSKVTVLNADETQPYFYPSRPLR